MFSDTVLNSSGSIRDFIDLAAVRRLFERHAAGFTQHGVSLWSILMLTKWCDTYLAAPPRQPAPARAPHQ
jgi:hypothetical protein